MEAEVGAQRTDAYEGLGGGREQRYGGDSETAGWSHARTEPDLWEKSAQRGHSSFLMGPPVMDTSCMALVVDAVIAASSEECGSRFASAVSSTTAGEEATAGMNAPSATGCTTRGRGSGPFQGLMCTPRQPFEVSPPSSQVLGVPATFCMQTTHHYVKRNCCSPGH